MIEKEPESYHLIKYDGHRSPEFFRLPKGYVKTLLTLFTLLIAIFLGIAIFQGLQLFIGDLKQIDLTQLKPTLSPLDQLKQELTDLKKENQNLIDKLNTAPSSAPHDQIKDIQWGLLEIPYAMRDLRLQNKLRLDNFEFTHNQSEISFQFNIINNGSESEKVQGYFWVAMVNGSQIFYYPFANEWAGDIGLKFTQGETFGVSRLRPVKAPFIKKGDVKQVRFIVYLFTREGDLLLYKLSEPYGL